MPQEIEVYSSFSMKLMDSSLLNISYQIYRISVKRKTTISGEIHTLTAGNGLIRRFYAKHRVWVPKSDVNLNQTNSLETSL